MIRHPEEQRIGERRMDIATSHRREQLRKDNRYRDRRSRSEQVPGSVAIKAGETLVRNSTIVGDRSGAEVETVNEQHIEPASLAGPSAVEELAAQLHDIYQTEAHRQGDVRHADEYASLSDDIKEFDRVMARFILAREQRHAEELDRLRKLAPLCADCGRGHGTRSGCPYCAMKKLYATLSQID